MAFQATATMDLYGRENALVLGVAADFADVAFASNGEVGTPK